MKQHIINYRRADPDDVELVVQLNDEDADEEIHLLMGGAEEAARRRSHLQASSPRPSRPSAPFTARTNVTHPAPRLRERGAKRALLPPSEDVVVVEDDARTAAPPRPRSTSGASAHRTRFLPPPPPDAPGSPEVLALRRPALDRPVVVIEDEEDPDLIVVESGGAAKRPRTETRTGETDPARLPPPSRKPPPAPAARRAPAAAAPRPSGGAGAGPSAGALVGDAALAQRIQAEEQRRAAEEDARLARELAGAEGGGGGGGFAHRLDFRPGFMEGEDEDELLMFGMGAGGGGRSPPVFGHRGAAGGVTPGAQGRAHRRASRAVRRQAPTGPGAGPNDWDADFHFGPPGALGFGFGAGAGAYHHHHFGGPMYGPGRYGGGGGVPMREALRMAAQGRGGLPAHLLLSNRDFNEDDYEALLALDDGVENRKGLKKGDLGNSSIAGRTYAFSPGHGAGGGEAPSCPICLADFERGETVRKTTCGHVFHRACIDKWLLTKAECPTCRQAFK